jgi:ElaB/YqjD/DUF883 family membrane-anchored ribosome-binding protein
MDNPATASKSVGSSSTQEALDKPRGAVKDGTRSAPRAASEAANVSDKANRVNDESARGLEKAAARAQELGQQGIDALTDASKQLRDRARQASDIAVSYAKEDPFKALLIAAAAGALLMGLLSMVVRSDD